MSLTTKNTTMSQLKTELGIIDKQIHFNESTKANNPNIRVTFNKESNMFFNVSCNVLAGITKNPETKLDLVPLPVKEGSVWTGYEIIFAGSMPSRVSF